MIRLLLQRKTEQSNTVKWFPVGAKLTVIKIGSTSLYRPCRFMKTRLSCNWQNSFSNYVAKGSCVIIYVFFTYPYQAFYQAFWDICLTKIIYCDTIYSINHKFVRNVDIYCTLDENTSKNQHNILEIRKIKLRLYF